MGKWMVLVGVYLWLGFTVGYFVRKWLEVSYLRRFHREHGDRGPGAAP